MSIVMEEDIKRCTARRKSALVIEILQDKITAMHSDAHRGQPCSLAFRTHLPD